MAEKGEVSVDVTELQSRSTINYGRQMSIPDSAITLTWSDLTVVSPAPPPSLKTRLCKRQDATSVQPDKVILDQVSGIAKPGQLLAIIGASGAGKTTFLNVLARQNTSRLVVSGSVLVNGKSIGGHIRDISAYVQQEDIFVGTMTVKEHLTFQAMLRMDKTISPTQKLKAVDRVLEEMGLKKCATTVIGIPGKLKGISGGEKKRLSFASEILTNPPLLFVDEPTSGLDSFMAETVVNVLQDMAKSGRTILCTIHQPSSEIFEMFGSLLLLAEGRTAYLGPRDSAVTYFEGIGRRCPNNYNPADFYVHTLAIVPGKESECKEKVKELCDLFDSSPKSILTKGHVQENSDQSDHEDKVDFKVKEGSGYNASLWDQFWLLLWRSWLTQTRDPTLVKVKVGQTIFMALLVGLIYLQIPYDQRRLQNVSGALFFMCVNSSLTNLFAVLQTFPLEMPVFLREHASRLYRVDLYYMTKHLSDVPFVIVLTFIYCVISYWMVGLQAEADKFFTFFGLLLLLANIALGVGYIVSAAAGNVGIALALGPVTVIPMMLFGGLFVNIDSVPVYFYWISYLSWFYYGFEALSINEWVGFTGIDCPMSVGIQCPRNGTTALNFFGLDEAYYYRDIGVLFALFVGARLIGLIILKFRVYRHERQ